LNSGSYDSTENLLKVKVMKTSIDQPHIPSSFRVYG
jgi:hypothetical protein